MIKLEIKKYRKLKNISQKQLANMCNLSQGYISMLENPSFYKTPTLEKIEMIADKLGVCPKDILIFECESCKNSVHGECKLKK